MNIADEGSSAHLQATVQKESVVASIKLESGIAIVNKCFSRWGLPKKIKVDNGYPFVSPGNKRVPTIAKLWWIGLGINVIQNHPRCPQQNGIVECLQGIICRWTGPSNHQSIEGLQKRIDEESDFQRNDYKIPSKQNKTRIELYPELETNPRRYTPKLFDIKRVHNFLSKKVWIRKVKKGGMTKFFNHQIWIGLKFAHQEITITLDPIEVRWLIRTNDGTLIATSTKGIPSKQEIEKIALMSKN